MATQGSGSIARMGTLVSRRRQGGSLGYTAPIPIHRQGTCLHSGPERPDRRPLAAEWMPRREAELEPLRAHGEPRGKGRPSPGCWSGTGRRSRRSAIAARSACCPKLATSSTDSQGSIEDTDGTPIPDPRVFPYNPRPVGANVTRTDRRRVRRHCVSTNSNTKPPRVCSNAVTTSRSRPIHPA